jgi:hypothetical protein
MVLMMLLAKELAPAANPAVHQLATTAEGRERLTVTGADTTKLPMTGVPRTAPEASTAFTA